MEALESDPRELFVRTVFLTGKGEVTPARLSYAHMRLRKIVTALSQCSRVAEQLMCVQPTKGIKRNWADIDISTLPAGAANKYRKALLNESLESSGMVEQPCALVIDFLIGPTVCFAGSTLCAQ
jgi:hypothetical protein